MALSVLQEEAYREIALKLMTELSLTDFNESDFCKMAEMEKQFYDKRAKILKEQHPLGLQVNLSTGVANGIIVTRSENEAAKLLYRSLTNSHELEIKESSSEWELVESVTQSTIRFVSKDDFLTKTFWANYLDLKRHQ